MIKLLNANFFKLKKSKLFLIMSLVIVLVALYLILSNYQDYKKYQTIIYYDNLCNGFLGFVGIIISIFTCMFLGFEYADGVVRNKIIIGHKRYQIYLANFITVLLVSLFFEIVYIFLISTLGIYLFGFKIEFGNSNFIYLLIMLQLIILSNVSIYTFISKTCSNSMLINVICIILAFGSYFLTLSLLGIIDAPKYITTAVVQNNEYNYVDELNPRYPSELKRKIADTLMDIVPQSQSIKIASNKVTNKKRMVIYSIITTISFNILGMYIFNKKELK